MRSLNTNNKVDNNESIDLEFEDNHKNSSISDMYLTMNNDLPIDSSGELHKMPVKSFSQPFLSTNTRCDNMASSMQLRYSNLTPLAQELSHHQFTLDQLSIQSYSTENSIGDNTTDQSDNDLMCEDNFVICLNSNCCKLLEQKERRIQELQKALDYVIAAMSIQQNDISVQNHNLRKKSQQLAYISMELHQDRVKLYTEREKWLQNHSPASVNYENTSTALKHPHNNLYMQANKMENNLSQSSNMTNIYHPKNSKNSTHMLTAIDLDCNNNKLTIAKSDPKFPFFHQFRHIKNRLKS